MAIEKKEIIFDVKTTGTDKAAKDINKIGASTQKAAGGIDGVGSSLGKLEGPLAGAANGFVGVGKSMIAMLANPVGLIITGIVGAFLALKKALGSTEEGQNKLSKGMAVLGTIVDKLFDALEPLAEFIADTLGEAFSYISEQIDLATTGLASLLDLLGFEDAAKGVRNYVDELNAAAEGAQKVSDIRAEAEKQERVLIIKRAEAERDLALLKEKAADADRFTSAERKQALLDAKKITEELSALEVQRATNLRDAIVLENSLTNSTKEAKAEEAKLEAELIAVETKASQDRLKIGKEEEKINKDNAAKAKKRRDDKAAAEKKALDEQIKREDEQFNLLNELTLSQQELEIQKLNEQYDKKFEIAQGNAELEKELLTQQQEDVRNINNEYANKKLEDERMHADNLRALKLELKELNAGELGDDSSPEEVAAYYEQRREIENEQFDIDQEELARKLETEQLTKEEFDVQSDILAKNHALKKDKIAKDSADYEANLQKLKVQNAMSAASNILGSIAQLAEEGSAIGKAAAVGQATMDTYKSAVAAYAAGSSVGGPAGLVLGPVAAGLAVAAGVLNVKKILSTKTPGGKSAGGGGGIPTPSASAAPSVNTQTLFSTQEGLQGAETEQVGAGAGVRQQDNTVRAYVTETDISDKQNIAQILKSRSEIG